MGPRNAYKYMLDKVVSPIACVNMNHQNQLEQMANEAMFATLSCNLDPLLALLFMKRLLSFALALFLLRLI
jgi:hypothetical protein